jgi:hypothetical protein
MERATMGRSRRKSSATLPSGDARAGVDHLVVVGADAHVQIQQPRGGSALALHPARRNRRADRDHPTADFLSGVDD